MTPRESVEELIHCWGDLEIPASFRGFVDETIRDGLQAPYAPALGIEAKLELLALMNATRLSDVIVGMVGMGDENRRALEALLHSHVAHGYAIRPWLLSRVNSEDLAELVALRDQTRAPVGMNVFISVSKIRMRVEGWRRAELTARLRDALDFGRAHFAEIRVAIEDATRTEPEALAEVVQLAAEGGATRLALADTAGEATPQGVRNLFAFVSSQLAQARPALEWHGHNDRGLAVANSLESIRAGASYVHGTLLGIGERNGNAALDTMLLNLSKLAPACADWQALTRYCERVRGLLGSVLDDQYPYLGRASFTSATGTHCAAIAKAFSSERPDLARRLFSPASYACDQQEPSLMLSRLSGRRGAMWLLAQLGVADPADSVDELLAWVRAEPSPPTPERLRAWVAAHAARPSPARSAGRSPLPEATR